MGYEFARLSSYNWAIVYDTLLDMKLEYLETTYDGREKRPKISVFNDSKQLVENQDYVIFYSNNIDAGTAKVEVLGKGNYAGTIKDTFSIRRFNLEEANVEKIDPQKYTGGLICPHIQVNGGERELVEGEDYHLSYRNNMNPGMAEVVITGINNYVGSVTKVFEIINEKNTIYDDVPETSGWRYDAIKYVKDYGIMNGISGTHNFAPDEPLTRAMFATIIYRMEGSPKASYSTKFPDVPDGNYFSVPIIWANKAGIINGHSNTGLFGTRENITREDMVVIMYRYCRVKGLASGGRADLGRFPDADQISGYAKEAVQWAVANGIINGRSNTGMLDPKGNASRVETAAIIQRFMSRIK